MKSSETAQRKKLIAQASKSFIKSNYFAVVRVSKLNSEHESCECYLLEPLYRNIPSISSNFSKVSFFLFQLFELHKKNWQCKICRHCWLSCCCGCCCSCCCCCCWLFGFIYRFRFNTAYARRTRSRAFRCSSSIWTRLNAASNLRKWINWRNAF